MSIGCHSELPAFDPKYPPPMPNNAVALSGGKITHFVRSQSKRLENPSDRVMLKACRQLKGIGNTARSGYVNIAFRDYFTGRNETTGADALVVGSRVLVQPAAVARFMGIGISTGRKGYVYHLKGHDEAMTAEGALFIHPEFQRFPQQYILLNPGSKFADVGGTQVALQQPVIWVDDEKQQIMLLSDLVKLFRVSDAQTGSHTIQQVKIVYKLPLGGRL